MHVDISTRNTYKIKGSVRIPHHKSRKLQKPPLGFGEAFVRLPTATG
jgi:hypothetical protein